MLLIVERAGISQIFDLAEHLDPDAPALGEVVLGTPTIFEAKALGLGEFTPLIAKERIRGKQEFARTQLYNGAEL